MGASSLRVKFLWLWALLMLAKIWLASELPLFGDEAFYALESRHLAWAYSDLPGLTAWLIRAGTELAGQDALAVRAPFLLLGAVLPWLVVRIASRWGGTEAGWQAGLLALLMPLAGLMGVLALPDVPMLFAALLCLDALTNLRERVGTAALLQLALGLALGALAHYRFALVLLAGAAGLALDPRGRALLREPRLWLALAFGAVAWWPLVTWNLAHAGAGLAFQFVDRHPWTLQPSALWWPLVQALLVTPVLFVLLLATLARAWRQRGHAGAMPWALLAGMGSVSVLGYFAMAFFADTERVSFHWPLAGWLALVCAAPGVLADWPRPARLALAGSAGLLLLVWVAYLALLSQPEGRLRLAAGPAYADNFSGWGEAAAAAREELATMPPGTRLVADNFMLGAQLAFLLDGRQVDVLEHPLNRKHGRALQLDQWGLLSRGRADWGAEPVLLVVEDTARSLKDRLKAYRQLCAAAGGLPPARVLNVDHGRKRFLVFRLAPEPTPCVVPSLAWLEAPEPGQRVSGLLSLRGWALREGAGVAAVDITLDGAVVGRASYGLPRFDVADYWGTDLTATDLGFSATVDLSGHPPGRAWLGLVVHGRDGSLEHWPEQPLQIR